MLRKRASSAMEACPSYRPWHDKQPRETSERWNSATAPPTCNSFCSQSTGATSISFSSIDDPSDGNKLLGKITDTKVDNNRAYKSFNCFDAQDQHCGLGSAA